MHPATTATIASAYESTAAPHSKTHAATTSPIAVEFTPCKKIWRNMGRRSGQRQRPRLAREGGFGFLLVTANQWSFTTIKSVRLTAQYIVRPRGENVVLARMQRSSTRDRCMPNVFSWTQHAAGGCDDRERACFATNGLHTVHPKLKHMRAKATRSSTFFLAAEAAVVVPSRTRERGRQRKQQPRRHQDKTASHIHVLAPNTP